MIYRNQFDYSLSSLDDNPDDKLSKFRVEPRDNAYALGISLTRRCNFNCMFCYYHSPEHTKFENHSLYKELAPESLEKIMETLPYLSAVNVSLEGEAFSHSRFLLCLEIISCHTASIILTTNGNLLSKELIEQVAALNKCRIILSFEEGSAAEYEYFRKGANFEKFKTAVGLLNDSSIDYLVYSILFHENKDSFLNYPRLASRLGIKKCGIGALRECPSSRANNLHKIPESEMVQYLRKLHEQFLQNQVTVEYEPYMISRQIRETLKSEGLNFSDHYVYVDEFCDLPWYYTSILADGRIFPCCGDFNPLEVGKYTFDTIFNNRYLLLLRKKIAEKHVPEVCLKCRNLL